MNGLPPETMARNVLKADDLLFHSKSKRLEELRVGVANGGYRVAKEKLAEVILLSMMRPRRQGAAVSRKALRASHAP